MEVNLKGDSKEVTLTEPFDLASREYGDKDGLTLCGKRSISIVTPASDYESFMTFDGLTKFTLKATDENDLGPQSVMLKAILDDYPEIPPIEVELSINIKACQITSLSSASVPA